MPTFAQRIPSFDLGIAAHASRIDTQFGTRLYVRVGHRLEEVGHRSEGVEPRSPFVVILSEYFEYAQIHAAMRFELRALRSLFLEDALVLGAMRCEPTTDAPRRTSALPRVRGASLHLASATVRTRKEALPVPRDAPLVACDALPVPCDAPLVACDALPIPCDALPVPCDALPIPRDAPRIRSDGVRRRGSKSRRVTRSSRSSRGARPIARERERVGRELLGLSLPELEAALL